MLGLAVEQDDGLTEHVARHDAEDMAAGHHPTNHPDVNLGVGQSREVREIAERLNRSKRAEASDGETEQTVDGRLVVVELYDRHVAIGLDAFQEGVDGHGSYLSWQQACAHRDYVADLKESSPANECSQFREQI